MRDPRAGSCKAAQGATFISWISAATARKGPNRDAEVPQFGKMRKCFRSAERFPHPATSTAETCGKCGNMFHRVFRGACVRVRKDTGTVSFVVASGMHCLGAGVRGGSLLNDPAHRKSFRTLHLTAEMFPQCSLYTLTRFSQKRFVRTCWHHLGILIDNLG